MELLLFIMSINVSQINSSPKSFFKCPLHLNAKRLNESGSVLISVHARITRDDKDKKESGVIG